MTQLVPRGPSSLDTYEDYDLEVNMYDWKQSDKGLILPLESFGLPPGVQTTTTPTLTLTPTTMRSFANDLLNGALDDEQTPYHNEAGFVPPIVHTSSSTYTNVDSKAWQGGSVTTMPAVSASSNALTVATSGVVPAVVSVPSSVSAAVPVPLAPLSVSPPLPSVTPTPSRKTGGRRPNKSKGISPEEEERRQVRRERNKAAAARCRKRRMDHTNLLVVETEGLESKKKGLQYEIQELTNQVKELQYLLDTHLCRHPQMDRCASPLDVKPSIYELKQEQQQQNSIELREPPMKKPTLSMPAPVTPAVPPSVPSKPSRPTSLPVSSHSLFRSTAAEMAGISVTTPSTSIILNFDSLMDGGTGLTPVSGPLVPSCSSQQRNQNGVDLSSPDSNITNKLVSL